MLNHVVCHHAKKMFLRQGKRRPQLAADYKDCADVDSCPRTQWHSCVIFEVWWPGHKVQSVEAGVFG